MNTPAPRGRELWAHRFRVLRRTAAKVPELLHGERGEEPTPPVTGNGYPVMLVTALRRHGPVGASTHITEAVGLLARHGHRTSVVSLDSWVPWTVPVLLAPSYVLRSTGLGGGLGVVLQRYLTRASVEVALRRRIRSEEPSVIYAQDTRAAWAALRARGERPIPVVMVVHFNGSEAQELADEGRVRPESLAERLLLRFEERLVPRLDGLVFVSDYMRRHLEDSLPAARGVPSVVIPNFLHDVAPDEAPDDAELPQGDCITIGYLVERKNHAYLLQVLAAARRRGHRYRLTVVGGGPEQGDLAELADALGVTEDVTFLGQRFDVDPLLRRHRLYVHSALMENCPYALLEAFRAGVPVLTSAVGGIPEVVGDGAAGRFWDLADPDAGADALIAMLEDPGGLAGSRRAARARFTSTYDAEVVGRRLEDLFQRARSRHLTLREAGMLVHDDAVDADRAA